MDKKDDKFVHPDGGYGWVIVFAIILINTSLLTLVQCFGIIFRDEFLEMGITSAETSFLLHLHSSIYCSIGFFSSPLLKKYSIRLVAIMGAGLMCLGIFLSSFAKTYGVLLFTTSVLIGVGQGILMPATYLATYSYFKKRLTIAVSLSVTGASISAATMPKVCDILLTHIGRRYTVLTLFAISLLSIVGCFLLKPPKSKTVNVAQNADLEELKIKEEPEKSVEASDKLLSEANSNGVYNNTTVPVKRQNSWWRIISDLFDLNLLNDAPYVLIIIGLGVSFAAELNVILMLQFILRELSEFNRSEVATAVSVLSIADIIGRLVVPFMSHLCNASSKWMYAGALVIASIGRTVLAAWGQSPVFVYFACGLIGLTKGSRAVFQSVIIPKIVPLDKVAAANGLNMLLTGALSLMLGPIIGAVHDHANSYVHALYAASGLSLSCVLLWIVETICFRRNQEEEVISK